MPIYTKTGDTGGTALFGGKRVRKSSPQVEVYGLVDESTSFIGLVHASISDEEEKHILTDIQWDLYAVMAYFSGAKLKKEDVEKRIPVMEQMINHLEMTLPKLTRFVLPQGSEQTVRLHVARAVVRTTERRIVEFIGEKEETTSDDELIMQYINRLSDFLFMLARKYSIEEKIT
jgi:cob(I)alamin adenosyltransferase